MGRRRRAALDFAAGRAYAAARDRSERRDRPRALEPRPGAGRGARRRDRARRLELARASGESRRRASGRSGAAAFGPRAATRVTSDIAFEGAAAVARWIAAGEITAAELARRQLERIAHFDAALRCYV